MPACAVQSCASYRAKRVPQRLRRRWTCFLSSAWAVTTRTLPGSRPRVRRLFPVRTSAFLAGGCDLRDLPGCHSELSADSKRPSRFVCRAAACLCYLPRSATAPRPLPVRRRRADSTVCRSATAVWTSPITARHNKACPANRSRRDHGVPTATHLRPARTAPTAPPTARVLSSARRLLSPLAGGSHFQ